MTAQVTSIAKMRAAARVAPNGSRSTTAPRATLLVLVVVLVVIGLGATQSASSAVAIEQAEDRFYFFKRQLVGVGIGTVALLIASRIPYQFYRKIAIPFFVVTVSLLVAVLAVGPVIGGAQRWLPVAGFSFQPSELAKVAVVFSLAYLLEKKHKLLDRFGHFLVPVVFIVGTVGLLVMKQPDLGTVIVTGAAALAVILASDAPLRYVAARVSWRSWLSPSSPSATNTGPIGSLAFSIHGAPRVARATSSSRATTPFPTAGYLEWGWGRAAPGGSICPMPTPTSSLQSSARRPVS